MMYSESISRELSPQYSIGSNNGFEGFLSLLEK